jgi:hypothetical protein
MGIIASDVALSHPNINHYHTLPLHPEHLTQAKPRQDLLWSFTENCAISTISQGIVTGVFF